MMTYCCRRLLKCPRNIFHMNLFVSFILRGCLTLLHIFLLPSSLQPSTDPADLDIDGAMAVSLTEFQFNPRVRREITPNGNANQYQLLF